MTLDSFQGRGRSRRLVSLVVGGSLLLALLVFLLATSQRARTMGRAFRGVVSECGAWYAEALTVEDTARADARIPLARPGAAATGPACGAYRRRNLLGGHPAVSTP
jgi:hypothetical protein